MKDTQQSFQTVLPIIDRLLCILKCIIIYFILLLPHINNLNIIRKNIRNKNVKEM